MKLPKVITTSVIRSTQQGESHGGVYLVDLDSGGIEQVIDWNDSTINWEGRGGDRGLRGVAFYRDKIYIAASDEIFVYNREFKLIESYRNACLKHCHEISVAGDTLYLSATELNSILEFDLAKKQFTRGYVIALGKKGLRGRIGALLPNWKLRAVGFDPNGAGPPAALAKNDLHINNVSRYGDAIMISGTRIEALLALEAGSLREYAPLPIGTHNAGLYKDGIIYNDTRANRVVIASRNGDVERCFPVPEYHDLPKTNIPSDYARQRFARGLCAFGDDLIIGGSSPSTISVYDIGSGETIRSINVSKDIRNCIHGLEIWPEEEK